MSHNYIVTAQKPTAVTACVTGKHFCVVRLYFCVYMHMVDVKRTKHENSRPRE